MKTSWDLSLIIKDTSKSSLDKLRNKVKKESYKFIDKWKNRTDYLENPKALKEALDEYNNWQERYSSNQTEQFYFHLLLSLDENNPQTKAGLNISTEFSLRILNDIQFFEIKLAKIDPGLRNSFLKSRELLPYKHFLERLFTQADHILTEAEEKIINLKSIPAHSNWVQMNQGLLSKKTRSVLLENGKKESKALTDLLGLMESKNKRVRDNAAKAFNEILKENVDISENEINSIFLNKKLDDELRNYKRPDESRHMADDIDTEVVDLVVGEVSKNFDLAKRYYKLKAKLLGVERLKYHERNVEYGKIVTEYKFEQGVNLIKKVFQRLDPQFSEIFSSFIDDGRIDVNPKVGKRGGAFCSSNLITDPVYILLNWTNKLNDVTTLAHEMGHGINDELIKKTQNALNFGTPTSTAEVASTFMEDFVFQELIKKADDETKLALMMAKLNQDISSIFRQIACYNLESELHKEFRKLGYLSKDNIGKIFQKNMNAYMGTAVEQSPGSENWWVYWNHIRYFFYVYSYASGLLISKSLQASVKKNPKFIVKVKEFLSAGLSDSPKNIFRKLGIDITNKKFWENGIKEVKNLLVETEKLAKELGKI